MTIISLGNSNNVWSCFGVFWYVFVYSVIIRIFSKWFGSVCCTWKKNNSQSKWCSISCTKTTIYTIKIGWKSDSIGRRKEKAPKEKWWYSIIMNNQTVCILCISHFVWQTIVLKYFSDCFDFNRNTQWKRLNTNSRTSVE